jgi:hypothetical protein
MDYKSTTTLKSLVVTDPRGSVIFVSDLFSGSISDNEICHKSGFYVLFLFSLYVTGFVSSFGNKNVASIINLTYVKPV